MGTSTGRSILSKMSSFAPFLSTIASVADIANTLTNTGTQTRTKTGGDVSPYSGGLPPFFRRYRIKGVSTRMYKKYISKFLRTGYPNTYTRLTICKPINNLGVQNDTGTGQQIFNWQSAVDVYKEDDTRQLILNTYQHAQNLFERQHYFMGWQLQYTFINTHSIPLNFRVYTMRLQDEYYEWLNSDTTDLLGLLTVPDWNPYQADYMRHDSIFRGRYKNIRVTRFRIGPNEQKKVFFRTPSYFTWTGVNEAVEQDRYIGATMKHRTDFVLIMCWVDFSGTSGLPTPGFEVDKVGQLSITYPKYICQQKFKFVTGTQDIFPSKRPNNIPISGFDPVQNEVSVAAETKTVLGS